MNAIESTLKKYGAHKPALKYFDADGPGLLPYATLVGARDGGHPDLVALVGVYEWQNSPLVFFVDGDQIQDDHLRLSRIRRLLAMRGEATYLGIVLPGQISFHRVGLDENTPDESRVFLDVSPGYERTTFLYLGNERPGLKNNRRWISDVILNLLSASIDELTVSLGVSSNDAISLVGRALFTRFLGDRDLLQRSIIPDGARQAAALFDGPEQAQRTSDWLDTTFNGDFLPLTQGLFNTLPKEAFLTLGNIMHRAPDRQLLLGWEENWDRLDFAHIPVGVLSQAYEHYLHRHQPERQRKEGGYYTPGHIADLMVRGAFHALQRDGSCHTATVLDPAVGAGVFLLTAFRHLVGERWRHDQKRPSTKVLREILYGQICGFDINEAALRFTALGLYLISIELDPNPEPVEKLKFKNLRNIVLHNFGVDSGQRSSDSIGSLGGTVSDEHLGRYDLVIGNPPWASATGLPGWERVKSEVSRIASTRLSTDNLKPTLPNEVLDLPFVWHALEWAKPGAQIAFALHARLLFEQSDTMPEARGALFSALDVTGIINGAYLRQTRVWPNISAPFCLLFARNQMPPPGAGFRFVSPNLERKMNNAGGWRVDANNAELIASEQVIQRPEILKILFRGSQLDLELYDRLASRELPTLREYWAKRFGLFRGRPKYTGNGYQKLRETSKKKMPADDLLGMPNLTTDTPGSLLIDTGTLPRFKLPFLHRVRSLDIYKAPLLIISESPNARTGRIHISISEQDVVFNQSFHGYSAQNHPQGKQLVRYLALLIHSKVALWHSLMTSGRFGFERDVIEKFIIDQIPVLPFEKLRRSDLEKVDELFHAVMKNDEQERWAEVDKWVASLYGLRDFDLQVIAETLKFNLPFAKNKRAAELKPTSTDIMAFCDTLRCALDPWSTHLGTRIQVFHTNPAKLLPWSILKISSQRSLADQNTDIDPPVWTEMLRIADQLAATEIVVPEPEKGCLWIGRLNQSRYWSRSQALLTARRVIWEHIDTLARHAAV